MTSGSFVPGDMPHCRHLCSSQPCTLGPALCVRTVGVPLEEDVRLHLLQEGLSQGTSSYSCQGS